MRILSGQFIEKVTDKLSRTDEIENPNNKNNKKKILPFLELRDAANKILPFLELQRS